MGAGAQSLSFADGPYGLLAGLITLREPVPAGFTRIVAFRSGLLGDAELCYQRYA